MIIFIMPKINTSRQALLSCYRVIFSNPVVETAPQRSSGIQARVAIVKAISMILPNVFIISS